MAALKHLVNKIDDAVAESLSGLCCTYPQLELQLDHKIVLSPDIRNQKDKVAVICGGGSGHEPFVAGFVGTGMLTASISGSIFASPPSKHITHAINCVAQNNTAGILVIVPNYTGDCLNFGIALEKAKQMGINITEIMVNEDCSIPKKEQSSIGKRGLTGMILVIKIAGALAERGESLSKILKYAKLSVENMATYAVGLSACSIPGQEYMFELASDEIEIGMGIHGEAGYERMKIKSASEIVAFMLQHISEELNLISGNNVVVVINNFGALSQLEQGIVTHETIKQLNNKGIQSLRVYSGLLVTSLNSAGIHITILKLPEYYKDIFLRCLDDSTNAPGWPGRSYSVPLAITRPPFNEIEKEKLDKLGIHLNHRYVSLMTLCLQKACKSIIEIEEYLNELDRSCGDGDCGTTLKRFAMGIQENMANFSFAYPSLLLQKIADIAEETMGGSSGALYCLFFTTGAKELSLIEKNTNITWVWSYTFRSALDSIIKYGKAKPGDRTMLDVLDPACETLEKCITAPLADIIENVLIATWEGCNATKDKKARAGRAAYVKQEYYMQRVDPGAYAAATWITAVVETIKNFKE
ncbi:PREDICTED: triokinase/FMN cyclase-like [Polistes dominula]|uniref:Triokinase/FMN cyclase n=1 Tax=Polistes dominula TaxID=743375 RepID=A0ABM1IZY7_POLDO|nr:PREDICTED: triokinase/FMN cyclase-like [Polistes dominula]